MSISEFRQDLVSGHWVLIATERAKKPQHPIELPVYKDTKDCPFDDPRASGQEDPSLVYNHGQKISWEDGFTGEWTTMVLKNKFPALRSGVCGPERKTGPFSIIDANGFHDLVITKDHDRSFAQFTQEETIEVVRAYIDRYRQVAQTDCGDYILIFHNHGITAGASLPHHHSQILSTPILPPEVLQSVVGAEKYFHEHGRKVHDVMIAWETEQASRIVYENEAFIVFCPFASRMPYEMHIFPRTSSPYFDQMPEEFIPLFADALQTALKKLYVALKNTDYNFYIHTAPVRKEPTVDYSFYHWHVEVVPRIGIPAGFEQGTGIYINTVDPDEAARILRETNV